MSVDTSMDETMQAVLRRFARDLWVRSHGTPRVTVLAGDEQAKHLWCAWLELAERTGTLFDGELDFDRAIRDAVAHATASPSEPVAVIARPATIAAWRARRTDRLAAMVDEGLLEVPPTGGGDARTTPPASPRGRVRATRHASVTGRASRRPPRGGATSPGRAAHLDARSAAEAAMFEALEATPATRGRFRLNESLSVRFGPRAAEVDLMSRSDRIAIEIDGVHHFSDPACYRRDREKDLLLQAEGLLVIRLLAEDVLRDPRDGVQIVCRALAYRKNENR
jgi:very-short-patch-repair endonuclease